MISKSIAIKVLNLATSTGADYAEIYLEENNKSSLAIDNGKVESSSNSLTYGAGIRLLKDLKSVYGYTNDISLKGLSKLAKELSASFQSPRCVNELTKISKVRQGTRNKIKVPVSSFPKDKLVEMLKKPCDIMKEYDPRIVRAVVRFSSEAKDVTIFTTEGKEFHDSRSRARVYLLAVAADEKGMETAGEGPGAQKGIEYFTEEVDLNKAAKEVAKTALVILGAKECPSGKMPVIIGNGFGGVIFHESCGHALEASSVSKGASVFSGKKGTKIASELVSAVDDGTIDGGWGSGNIDDEGNPTKRNLLIKNGILNSYLVDNFNGRRMGEKGNGASRRESYRYEPTSRMSNTFILAGKSTPEEIIASTKFGLYAKSLGGGSVNPATGEFNFAVMEGYIVKDGKIAYPVKGATLIGSGKDVLLKIDMVGNDLLRAQGMCGAASGSIPADVGEPTIRVSEMTVGGSGGAI